MGTDKEARALGAGVSIEIDGKKYTIRPITIRQLAELEREALSYYKREYLKTYKNNLDLLEDNESAGLLQKKLEEVSKWDTTNLPTRKVFDASSVSVTNKAKKWIQKEYDITVETDDIYRLFITLALDQSRLTSEQVKGLTGSYPREGNVRYDQWWITGTTEGMIHFVTEALASSNIKYEDVCDWSYEKLVEACRKAEHITAAEMGNG